MKKVFLFLVLCCVPAAAKDCHCRLPQRDWKRAFWRGFPHVAMSLAPTIAEIPLPWLGRKYVRWRWNAEKMDERLGTDSEYKAQIDFYSQTAIPRSVLWLYHIKVHVGQNP